MAAGSSLCPNITFALFSCIVALRIMLNKLATHDKYYIYLDLGGFKSYLVG